MQNPEIDIKTPAEREFLSGAPKTIRTSDLSLRRGALYPAELWVLVFKCGLIVTDLSELGKMQNAPA
jgi:hypothetical protein